MNYLGKDIKKLGFGLMRLPKIGEEIDIEQTKTMVDMFMSNGFTYFDTAWAYAGSEDAIRQALVERYPRESYVLATKNAAWLRCNSREEALGQFDSSLKLTNAGYFDFYLLHNLGGVRTQVFENYDLWNWALEQKTKGFIKHLGFSFHGTPDELREILQKHPEVEFVQLQINYADWEEPSVKSRECYEICREFDKPIVIMEPVKGGLLADPPPSVKSILDRADKDASYASWAVRYAADLEGVITVLSGMSNIQQMRDNISYMREFKGLTEKQRATIELCQQAMNKVDLIPCTSCNYCLKVCPKNIAVSGTFAAVNNFALYNNLEAAMREVSWQVNTQSRNFASECIKCGRCEAVCPQHIEIRKHLEESIEILK